jgi:large subunit ribosomal protein L17
MRHRKYTFKIGRTSEHRRALLANAVCSLFKAGRISTTVTKAKEIRRLAEKMITLAKRGTLHARRQAIATLRQPATVAELFSKIAPEHEDRQSGYTRILRLGQRLGDGADMCLLELIQATPVGAEAGAATVNAEPAKPASAEAAKPAEASAGEPAAAPQS